MSGSFSKSRGSSSQQSTQSSTSQTTPYGPAAGTLQSLLGGIDSLFGKAAEGGGPGVPIAAQEYSQGLLAGTNPLAAQATGQNPHREYSLNRGSEAIRSAIARNASAAGRYGSGAHASRTAAGIGDYANRFLGAAYEGDQNRALGVLGLQNQAAGQASQLALAPYAAQLGVLGGLGPLAAQIAQSFGVTNSSGTGSSQGSSKSSEFGISGDLVKRPSKGLFK